jgi:hypothetical protein
MNNVSLSCQGQRPMSSALLTALGVVVLATSTWAYSNDGDVDESAVPAAQMRDQGQVDRSARAEQRRAEMEARRTAARPESAAGDRRALKRALVESDRTAATAPRSSMSREERRALKRDLRSAMEGANNGDAAPN